MKVTAMSDLHGNLINIEPCDLVLICGDISPLDIQKDHIQMTKWIFDEFQTWIINLPCDKVILTPGNHDFWFEKFIKTNNLKLFDNKLEILIDGLTKYYSSTEDKYLSIYGTPWCKMYGYWPFMPGNDKLPKLYDNIPENIDILISHDSSALLEVGYIHYDEPLDNGETKIPEGNYWLGEEILKKKPKYALSGHIHSGDHDLKEQEGIKLANCSILDESYSIYYKPLTFEI